jgi:hypothetical protein
MVRCGALAVLVTTACIQPPAAAPMPTCPSIPNPAYTEPGTDPRDRFATRVSDLATEEEHMSTIGAVARMWSARYRNDTLTGLFVTTEEDASDECKSTPIAKMKAQLDLSGLLTDPMAAGQKVLDKAKVLGGRIKNAWNRRPNEVLSEQEKEAENREILGYPLKDLSDDVRLTLEGKPPRGWVAPSGEENEQCDCLFEGALKSDVGMCKAFIYRTKKRHRVWQILQTADGTTPTYPFKKFWNPFAMRIPSPNPLPGEVYFSCDIPANTLIAVGIGKNPRWKPPVDITPEMIMADPTGAMKEKFNQNLEEAKNDVRDSVASAASVIVGEQVEDKEQWLTQWYVGQTSGFYGSDKPPGHWNCKVIPLLCAPIVGCVAKPDLTNALGPGAPPIPVRF